MDAALHDGGEYWEGCRRGGKGLVGVRRYRTAYDPHQSMGDRGGA